MRRALLGHAYVMGEHAHDGEVVVYRLYGHYSFNARDGGEQVTLQLAAGYFSVEQALYHGFAKIVA
jgi:cupin superfamily acireductone dioxygenase involved in methionine salvage